MKKQFEQPIIEVVTITSEDVIKTSGFGQSFPGDNPIDFDDFWN